MKRYLLPFLSWMVLLNLGVRDMGAEEVSQAERKIKIYSVKQGVYEEVEKVNRTQEEWKKILTPEQFYITRQHGTEPAFSGEYWDHKKKGIYQCIGCGTDLFHSDTKFESGTGWPSYWEPVAKENLGTQIDSSFFMRRVEVHCSRCGAHLGHVFDDGPPPTGKRYCINSAALKFLADQKQDGK